MLSIIIPEISFYTGIFVGGGLHEKVEAIYLRAQSQKRLTSRLCRVLFVSLKNKMCSGKRVIAGGYHTCAHQNSTGIGQ